MFNLDHAITEWRRQMTAGGVKAPRVLDELEGHLREEIRNQRCYGLAPEQAFATAVRRLGVANELKPEFEKVSQERRRNWLRIGSLVVTFFLYTVVIIVWIFQRRTGRLEMTNAELLLGAGAMLATLFFGLSGSYFAKFLPVIANEKLQVACIYVMLLLGVGLLQLLWSYLALESVAHVLIVTLWTMSPFLGFGLCSEAWCHRCKTARVFRAEPEHVLLGLLDESGGVAAVVLNKFGVDAAKAREQIRKQSANRLDDRE